jgi:hypothetical protein
VPPSPRNRRGSITSPGARSCARRPRRWWTTTRRRKRRRRRERTPPRRRRSDGFTRRRVPSPLPPASALCPRLVRGATEASSSRKIRFRT